MAMKRGLFDRRKIKIFEIYGATKDNVQNISDRLILRVINKQLLQENIFQRKEFIENDQGKEKRVDQTCTEKWWDVLELIIKGHAKNDEGRPFE